MRRSAFALSILLLALNAHAALPTPPKAASPDEDGEWRMPAKDPANTRYSGLTQIDASNVKSLQPLFSFSTETNKGQESPVLAVKGTLYFTTSYPNYLFAIDLTKPGGAVKWKFDPKPNGSAQGMACCQPVNRGPVYDNGTLYYNTVDAHTFAIDTETGKVKWKTKVGDLTRGETFTMAPIVVNGKVLVGNSGAGFGARGWPRADLADPGLRAFVAGCGGQGR